MLNLQGISLAASLVWRVLRIGPPPACGTAERLANLPLRGAPLHAPLRIFWNAHQVPSIEARDAHDLAVGLGVVHAHLRLVQMEVMRRLATGTVAELAGPAAVELDRALRLIGFGRAVPGIAAMLPPETRAWAEAFVAGLNHVIAHAPALPYEFGLFRARPAPWTLTDLLTVARLAATDVSWLVFVRLLRGRATLETAEWQRLWPVLQQADTLPWPGNSAEAALGLVRGSNSAAVAGGRPGQGSGIIASDPHLPIMLPALWLIAALHAPGLDAVGLMIPGLPVLALGRNRWIAWGGTSLHAASSELVEVTGERLTERPTLIPVRGGNPVRLVLRDSEFGPVVSDGMLLRSPRPLALRWVGHRPSDEMTAMLGVMRARDLQEFRAALRGFAVPGQTMVAAEAGPGGRAGRVIAAHLPRRASATMSGLTCTPPEAWGLEDLVTAADFPLEAADVVTSANDRPANTPVPVGFFFSMPLRARRMRSLLEAAHPADPATMRRLQQDVLQSGALLLRDALLSRLSPPPADASAALQALRDWDGSYGLESAGALVFEALTAGLACRMLPRQTLALLSDMWSGRALIGQRIAGAPASMLRAALRDGARALRRHGTWGAVHRLSLRHPLAALPLVGHRFALPDMPFPGGNDTLNKTSHGPVHGRHHVTYGACARHISDLADPDANHFVLLGGQDGWLGSANAADQVALWRKGEMIAVPLRAEGAHSWPHCTELVPP